MLNKITKLGTSIPFNILFCFAYSLVISPFSNGINFILYLLLIELLYIIFFKISIELQLAIVVGYLLGWITGRQLYLDDDELFKTCSSPKNWVDHLIYTFSSILDIDRPIDRKEYY